MSTSYLKELKPTLIENMVFCDIVQMTRNIQCDMKMVQCDMNVWNDAFKLMQMFGMMCPKCHKIVIKDRFSTSTRLQALWISQPLDASFFSKLRKRVRFYREHYKFWVAQRKLKEEEARKDLEEAARDLHENPGEQFFCIAHSICQLHLKKLEAQKIAGR